MMINARRFGCVIKKIYLCAVLIIILDEYV